MTSGETHTRVLRLITRLNIGGPAQQALLLTKGLGSGYESILAAGEAPEIEGEMSDPAVTVARIPLVRPIEPLTDMRALRAIRSLVREFQPHLLHTHMAKAGLLGRLAVRRSAVRVKTVHTFHGHVLDAYFRPSVQRSFVEIERRLARRTDALVAVSEEIKDTLLGLGIGAPHQWTVIPLGLDLSSFFSLEGPSGVLRSRIGIPENVPLIGILGRLVDVKNHLMAFRVVERLAGVHLAVIGDGVLRAELEETVAALGLTERVHFTGWWMGTADALSDLDVVILTSKNEGTPVALIEALASRVPVVATEVGGVASVVKDGVTGILVPREDDEAMSGAVERLLAAPQQRISMGSEGRRFVEGRYGSERLVQDIRDLYDRLLHVSAST